MDPAILAPHAARELRASLLNGVLTPRAIKTLTELDRYWKTEADLQSLWLQIVRRPELASAHAIEFAQEVVGEQKKTEVVKRQQKRPRPPAQWIYDLATYCGEPLSPGIIGVWWSAVGSNLSKAEAGKAVAMGRMLAVPDLRHVADFRQWDVEVKGRTGRLTVAQSALGTAMRNAGHRVHLADSLSGLGAILVSEMTKHA